MSASQVGVATPMKPASTADTPYSTPDLSIRVILRAFCAFSARVTARCLFSVIAVLTAAHRAVGIEDVGAGLQDAVEHLLDGRAACSPASMVAVSITGSSESSVTLSVISIGAVLLERDRHIDVADFLRRGRDALDDRRGRGCERNGRRKMIFCALFFGIGLVRPMRERTMNGSA
jgi:hypothetical protein